MSQHQYRDSTGKLQPVFASNHHAESGGDLGAFIYGDTMISLIEDGDVSINIEAHGGILHVCVYDAQRADNPILDVKFTHDTSRSYVRALLHALVGNTHAAAKSLDAAPYSGDQN